MTQGDINIAHREIDHCEPSGSDEQAFRDHPCRQWMDAVVYDVDVRSDSLQGIPSHQREPGRLVDSFRYFHPLEAKAYTVSANLTVWAVLKMGGLWDKVGGCSRALMSCGN